MVRVTPRELFANLFIYTLQFFFDTFFGKRYAEALAGAISKANGAPADTHTLYEGSWKSATTYWMNGFLGPFGFRQRVKDLGITMENTLKRGFNVGFLPKHTCFERAPREVRAKYLGQWGSISSAATHEATEAESKGKLCLDNKIESIRVDSKWTVVIKVTIDTTPTGGGK